MRLTALQWKTLRCIADLTTAAPPTMQEVAKHMEGDGVGLTGVYSRVEPLRLRRLVAFERRGRRRVLVLTPLGESVVAEGVSRRRAQG